MLSKYNFVSVLRYLLIFDDEKQRTIEKLILLCLYIYVNEKYKEKKKRIK